MSAQLNEILEKQQRQHNSVSKDVEQEEDIIQLVGFIVGDEEYAVPILSIQEIVKPIEHTRVPSVPSYVLGVLNMRGNVLPLIDLRGKFNLPSKSQTLDTRYMVMKDGNNEAAFVIDKLTEAIRIKSTQIDPPPDTLQRGKAIYGIGKRNDSIITILKVEELLKKDF